MYWSKVLFPLLAVPACQAFPSIHKRASVTGATLYAYGTNISGFPVVYAHENAELYVAQSNTTISGLDSITWDIPSMTAATTTATTGYLINGTSVGGMYIDPSDNLYDEVVVSTNGTVGLTVYGKQLVYYNGSTIQSEFWAKEVAQGDGATIWVLHWNSDNESQTGAVPVVVKTIASSSSS